ncbi:MAG: hypothetical protein RMM29_01120 [Planctomycetota bacterium]|nr:hypothetical protein [Planctomycetota bacterium]MCX8039659.1 hypothetical protein [Planctomycetota bacterium]MDW8372237.1 hypothetical protein [Planctomycetota bacterium]
MRRLCALAAAVLILAGCDPAVQARQPPTSVDQAFGPFAWRSPDVPRQVYELPAERPALDPRDAQPRTCRRPGPRFPPSPLVGLRADEQTMHYQPAIPLVGWQEPPLPAPPPLPGGRLFGWREEAPPGPKEPIATRSEPLRLQPGRSLSRAEPIPLVAYRRDEYSWCNPAANLR